ncbi:LytTR family transcriptional regulator [Sphingomonas sp. HDW15A]|nr:LytTR family transcriptional regulator [Sphingomonas sp. HDW15A]
MRVHTCSGSALVLHRLADAISEVGAIDGLQVHRSWWVASHSVSGTFIRDSRRWLRLANGLEVPVSRARIRDVTARGWPAIDPPTA